MFGFDDEDPCEEVMEDAVESGLHLEGCVPNGTRVKKHNYCGGGYSIVRASMAGIPYTHENYDMRMDALYDSSYVMQDVSGAGGGVGKCV